MTNKNVLQFACVVSLLSVTATGGLTNNRQDEMGISGHE